ncbi:10300_t:CDS:2 [Gigaspora margarita]|uniref:10300_t:CDS:1 n=1 Tax=Gigaspora margarita TaxID=4874 RepID=A0ABN7UL03_GIGMA|nr:10300_t:CDS:2 [Gigaspora margarita]
MASSDTQISVNETQQEVSSTTNQNTLPTHDEGLGEVKKLNKDAIISDTKLEKVEKLKDVFSDANLISDGIPDNVKKSNSFAESTNDSSSIIISRTVGTRSEHSMSANSPTVSSMIVSSVSSKHSRSGSETRKKGPPSKVPPKSEKVVRWKSQRKENDLPKQNPEAPLKKVPSSNQFEVKYQNNARLKNKVPPDTLQETNNSSETLFKEVEIKEVKETNSLEIDLSKQQPETLTNSYQTKPEETMTFESIHEHLAKKGIVDNNSLPAIPPKVSTSNKIQSEVMNFDEIHKHLGLSDSQSTPMPFLPNNNLLDTSTSQTNASENPPLINNVFSTFQSSTIKDNNTSPLTDDKTNNLEITPSTPTSQFSIETDKNPPLINNEINNPAIIPVEKDTHTFQSNTSEDNNNTVTISTTLPSQFADKNIPPLIDIENNSKEQSTPALIINYPLENSIFNFNGLSSPSKEPNNNTVTISATLPSQFADKNIPPLIDIENDSKEQSTPALIINNI